VANDLETLARAQQDTAQSITTLVAQLNTDQGRALDTNSQALADLGQVVTANSQELGKVSQGLGGLPSLIAGLAGRAGGGGGILGGLLSGGLGIASLGLGIARLFGGGGGSDQPPAVTKYQAPPSLALQVANTDNAAAGYAVTDQGQAGEVRVAPETRAMAVQPQVTVNVSAMDSRSFLDHSAEIAQAVRDAMLYMHPVNDLINEL
jgi:hypothetical protein